MFHLFWDEKSKADIGTMFAAKSHLNAFTVPRKPMQDVDATYEFLEKYTKALIIAKFNDIRAELTEDQLDGSEKGRDEITGKLLDEFIFPGIESADDTSDDVFTCEVCYAVFPDLKGVRNHTKRVHEVEKETKFDCSFPGCRTKCTTMETLQMHLKVAHHHELKLTQEYETHKCDVCGKSYKKEGGLARHKQTVHAHRDAKAKRSTVDHIYRYSSCAAGIGLLAMSFNESRKNGDGNRIISLYKYLLLLYKLDGRDKYTYYTMQLLQQVIELLPE